MIVNKLIFKIYMIYDYLYPELKNYFFFLLIHLELLFQLDIKLIKQILD